MKAVNHVTDTTFSKTHFINGNWYEMQEAGASNFSSLFYFVYKGYEPH